MAGLRPNFPSPCFDGTTSTNGLVDGPGVTGRYDRKHVPALPFESVRLNPAECGNVQPLANFDPMVNFAFVAPNEINNMHDGTTATRRRVSSRVFAARD